MDSLAETSIILQQAIATFKGDHPNLEDVTIRNLGMWMDRRLDWLPSAVAPYVMDELALLLPNPYQVDDYQDSHIQPLNWDEFWEGDLDEDFLVDPLIAKHRLTALFAAGKTGKSLLTLEVAAALATATQTLNSTLTEPASVVYIDQEMTPADLMDRLEVLGYSKTDRGLHEHLHYYQMQSFAPLDTPEGGQDLWTVWQRHEPELMVIDTVARVVQGEENSADTYRALYRESLLRIKATGTAILRIDHAGKDAAKGQRGSSAKNDDVDVVWRLDRINDNALQLICDRKRMGWVPSQVSITRKEDSQGRLRHFTEQIHLTPNQESVVQFLDDDGAPHDISRRKVRKDYPDLQFRNTEWDNISRFRRARGPLFNTPPMVEVEDG